MAMIHRLAAGAFLLISPSMQGASADHWRFVPPLTTACFNDDNFLASLDAAKTNIEAEIDKQKKINVAAREIFDKMDMMEKAQKMQAFMMKNPQAAAKMMQAQNASAASATDDIASANASAPRLDAELKGHQASFRTSIDQAAKTVKARVDAHVKAKTVPVGEAAVPMFTTAADHAQYVQLVAEENAATERACGGYFGATGAFQKWLASYRTEVTEKMIGAGENADPMVMQLAAMDLPGGNYKSTVPLEQVRNYLQTVRTVYSTRPSRAKASIELRKQAP